MQLNVSIPHENLTAKRLLTETLRFHSSMLSLNLHVNAFKISPETAAQVLIFYKYIYLRKLLNTKEDTIYKG